VLIPSIGVAAENNAAPKVAAPTLSHGGFDAKAAERFAKLALACVSDMNHPAKISSRRVSLRQM